MSQWLPYHPTMTDPSTGEPLRALTIIGNLPVWPSIGFQDDDGSEGEAQTDPPEGEGAAGGEGEGDPPEENTPDTVSREEYLQVQRRMQAADRAKAAAEAKVKEYEKAGQTELEKIQSELEESKRAAETVTQELQNTRIANAFLASNDITWHNPERALKVLQSDYMDDVEIAEDGKVTGIKEAIKKMAKAESYLVNSGSAGSSTEDPMNGKRKGDKNETTTRDAELKKRMPALGRRIS